MNDEKEEIKHPFRIYRLFWVNSDKTMGSDIKIKGGDEMTEAETWRAAALEFVEWLEFGVNIFGEKDIRVGPDVSIEEVSNCFARKFCQILSSRGLSIEQKKECEHECWEGFECGICGKDLKHDPDLHLFIRR